MLPDGTEIEQNDHVVVIQVRLHELTQSTMTELVGECLERLRYSGAQNFVFDFDGVEFLASACVGALVNLLQEVEHVRGRIALSNCSENVMFLFKVTKLDDVFAMYDDVDEATSAVKA